MEAALHAVISGQWRFDAGYTWLSTKVVESISSGDPTATLIAGQSLPARSCFERPGNVSLDYRMVAETHVRRAGARTSAAARTSTTTMLGERA